MQLPGLGRIHGRDPQARGSAARTAERRRAGMWSSCGKGLRYVVRSPATLRRRRLATGSSNFFTNVVFADLLRLRVPVSRTVTPALIGPGRRDRRRSGWLIGVGVGRLAAPTARRRTAPRSSARQSEQPAAAARSRSRPRATRRSHSSALERHARRLRRGRLQHPAGEPAPGDHARTAAGPDERRRCASSSGGRSRSGRSSEACSRRRSALRTALVVGAVGGFTSVDPDHASRRSAS